MSRRLRFIFTGLIVMSLVFQVFMAFFESGMHQTPFGSRDANGALYAFSEPVTTGHLALILSRANVPGALQCMGYIGAACVASHLLGVALLWCSDAWRLVRMTFFAFQALLPTSWIGALMWLIVPFDAVMDGEDLDEGIGFAVFAAASWFVVSTLVFIADARARNADLRALPTSPGSLPA